MQKMRLDKIGLDLSRPSTRSDSRSTSRHSSIRRHRSGFKKSNAPAGIPEGWDKPTRPSPLRPMPKQAHPLKPPHVLRVHGLRRSMHLVCQGSPRHERRYVDDSIWAECVMRGDAEDDEPHDAAAVPAWHRPPAGKSIRGSEPGSSASPPCDSLLNTSVAGSPGVAFSRQRKEVNMPPSLPIAPARNRSNVRRDALACGILNFLEGGEEAVELQQHGLLDIFATQTGNAEDDEKEEEKEFKEEDEVEDEEGDEENDMTSIPLYAESGPSVVEALARYEQEDFSPGEVKRMRMAYRRFIMDATSELIRSSLYDTLIHLGYLTITEQLAEEIASAVSKFSTFDFPEFCLFIEKCAEKECSTARRSAADWCERGPCSIEGVRQWLSSMGMITTLQAVHEALELTGMDPKSLQAPQQLLRILATLRTQEGFVADDVARARKVYEGLRTLATGPARASELPKGLLDFAGLHCTRLLHRLLEKLPPACGCMPELSFPEFLIWARRVRDADMQILWDLFLQSCSAGSGAIRANDLDHILARLGLTLLSEGLDELLADANLHRADMLDFSTTVNLVQGCRQSSGFLRQEIEEFTSAFERFDINGTGELPNLQVLELLRFLGHTTRLEEVHTFINLVDFNKNGTMDFNEFLVLMRFRREQDIKRARSAFEKIRGRRKELPAHEITQALKLVGQEPPLDVLQEVLRAGGNRARISFEAFVRINEQCRGVTAIEARMRAGMAKDTFNALKRVFNASDPTRRGFIELGELVQMFARSDVPVNTHEGRQAMFKSLDTARSAAVGVGIEASEVGQPGSPRVRFWELVHLVQSIIREHEENVLTREQQILQGDKISIEEACHFREVFNSMIKEFNDSHDGQASEQAKSQQVPQLAALLRQSTSVRVLPKSAFLSAMNSIGMQISMQHRGQLDRKLRETSNTAGGLDFPSFLQVIRWMLDTDFADINKAAEVEAMRVKRLPSDSALPRRSIDMEAILSSPAVRRSIGFSP